MIRIPALASLAGALLAAACTPQPAAEASPAATAETAAAVHPESGLPVIPLTVTSASGRHAFRVEVASSEAEQAKGLMFRTALGPSEGMIFPRNPPDVASFWMKNTPLPLDIIFIGPDRRILNIATAQPYDLTPVTAAGLTTGVLEIPGGRAAELGIKAGDTAAW